METAITKATEQHLTAADVRAHVNLIQEVMAAVMKPGVHYGTIPGCGGKKTLLKAGSEIILTTFRIAVDPKVEDLSTEDTARYRVTTHGVAMGNGTFVGAGVGECSSDEEKYKWRAAVCAEEFEETPANRRRIKWGKGKGQNPAYKKQQVRTEAADVANTVLKMSKKRSQVDMTLTSTAASDLFDQDTEDMPESLRGEQGETRDPVEMPTAKPKAKAQQAAPSGAANEVTGEVEQVTSKEGNTNGRDWTRYGVKIGGVFYGTFDSEHAQVAEDAKENQEPVVITFTTDGKGYHTITAIAPVIATPPNAPSDDNGEPL